MTQKLKILGPYTPEHPGPFCTRDGRRARIICTDKIGPLPMLGLVWSEGFDEFMVMYTENGFRNEDGSDSRYDLMNAEEVPVAREFWVNEYTHGIVHAFNSEAIAKSGEKGPSFLRTIHVREVMPGDGE